DARLGDQTEGPFGMAARVDLGLAPLHLSQRPAHVHRPGLAARGGFPGDRPGQGPVDLAHAGAVAEALQGPAVPTTEPAAGQVEKLAGGEVETARLGWSRA